MSNVHLLRLVIVAPTPPPLGGMALQAQLLCDCLLAEGIEARIIPTNPPLKSNCVRLKGIRTLVQSWIFLVQLCRELPRAPVIHILAASYMSFFLKAVPAIILGRVLRRRVILNYRGGAAQDFFSAWKWIVRPVFRMVDAIVVPSRFLERVFSEHGFSTQVIPNLIDLKRFRFRRRKRIAPRLLVTRNLEPIYNVRMAIEAYKIVKKAHAEATLDIVGNGTQESELRRWVKQQALEGVVFHGAVPNERIPTYLDQADIFLNPSLVDNMPISLLEAFASGVPVVSTSAGGIPDLVGNNGVVPPGSQAAFLVEPGNFAQMAERIEELLRYPERVQELTELAKALCEEFTWRSVRDRWLEVYGIQYNSIRAV